MVELKIQKDYLQNQTVETIYFGGGTPSLLDKEELHAIVNTIQQHYSLAPMIEFTLEANPDDLSKEKLRELREVGVNRLSIGIQSFFDEHLTWMNRSHTAQDSLQCVKKAQDLGFENITIDLIYGLPNLTQQQWQSNIQQALDLDVPHISAYNLTVEKKTALAHFIKTGKVSPPNDEIGALHFEMLITALENNDFLQYETSNFAKNGKLSMHNSSYWRGKHYLGIGASAHSYNGNSRQWNIANNKKYITAIKENKKWYETEQLSKKDKVNEHLLIGLRTIWGCDLNHITSLLTPQQNKIFNAELTQQINNGYLQKIESHLTLTPKGKLFADRIASDLFVTD